MDIIWKDIQEYENEYSISNTGIVKGKKYNRELKPFTNKDGYQRVTLCKEGKTKNFYLHRIVAQHFKDNFSNKPQVNHIDGDKLNNTAINLEWVTCSENHLHAFATGLKVPEQSTIGDNKGKTSNFMYVTYHKSDKEEKYQATLTVNKITKSRSFSVKKYGKKEAELLAAKAANELIDTYPEFQNRPKNII